MLSNVYLSLNFTYFGLLQDITDVTIIAACGPPGGGRNPVSPRLLKNFWWVQKCSNDLTLNVQIAFC